MGARQYPDSAAHIRRQAAALTKKGGIEEQVTQAVLARLETMKLGGHERVSPRELEVWLGLIDGETVEGAMERMGVARQTVSKYRENIKFKLGLEDGNEKTLLMYAVKIATELAK